MSDQPLRVSVEGDYQVVDGPSAMWLSTHHVKLVPNEYGVCSQVEVSKHRAEDRAQPLMANDILDREGWANKLLAYDSKRPLSERFVRHAYDRHPTPKDPMVRYGQFRHWPDTTAEFVRDDGTDNLESIV